MARLVRDDAKSSTSGYDQEKNWLEVTRKYIDKLSWQEQITYWRDYYRYRFLSHIYSNEPIDKILNSAELCGMLSALTSVGRVDLIRESLNIFSKFEKMENLTFN